MILRIAKLELHRLFSSPIAWVMLALFAGKTGIDTVLHMSDVHTAIKAGASFHSLTWALFFQSGAPFDSIQTSLMLVVPLLTMGLISQERSSGTIKLLYSAPIQLQSLVIGKFLAIVSFSLILLAISAIIVTGASLSIAQPDHGTIAAGFLAIICILITYSAIGLFTSSLTNYPVIAAILTIIVFIGLDYLEGFVEGVPLVSELVYWFSPTSHLTDIQDGLIQSKDLIYFILISALFVLLTLANLNAQRLQGKMLNQIRVKMAVAVVTTLILGNLTTNPFVNFSSDWTATKTHTLDPTTSKLLDELNGDLEIVHFGHILKSYNIRKDFQQRTIQSWAPYERHFPQLKQSFLFFGGDAEFIDTLRHREDLTQAQKEQAVAELFEVPEHLVLSQQELHQRYPAAVNKNPRSSGEMLFAHNNNSVLYPSNFNDQYLGGAVSELELASVLKRLKGSALTIGFLTGHYEAGLNHYKDTDWGGFFNAQLSRYAAINLGFDFTQVELNQPQALTNIDILVIADPKAELSDNHLAQIDQYLAQGGDLLLAFDPSRVEVVAPLLTRCGLTANTPSHRQLPNNESRAIVTKQAAQKLNTAKSALVIGKATGLEVVNNHAEFEVTPLVNNFDTQEQTMMLLERTQNGKQQKIVVSSETGLFSNKTVKRTQMGPTHETQFVLNLFRMFSNDQYPVRLDVNLPKDLTWQLTNDQLSFYRYLYMLFLPLIPVVFGVVIWRRKSKR